MINDFFHFLTNFGVDIWYDRRNIFLGDNRIEANIDNGVANPNVNYAIIFYSENFIHGNICLEEFDILVNRYYNKEVFLFPVFITKVPQHINEKYRICKDLVYTQIKDQSDFHPLVLHVFSKITSDHISGSRFKCIRDIEENYDDKSDLYYKLIVEYQCIRKTNYNMRIAALYSLFVIMAQNMTINFFYRKTMNYIFHQNCLYLLKDEKRELQIMENIICYLFSDL